MKRIVIFLLAFLIANAQCMEQPALTVIEAELGSIDNLPDELIVYLFSFIPQASSAKEIFNKLAQLSLVNRKFAQIAEDKAFIKQLAKAYIESYPKKAEKEFLDAAMIVLSQNCTSKDHQRAAKLISALALAITIEKKGLLLLKAICNGRIRLAKLLLYNDANVNATTDDIFEDMEGRTPLMRASQYGFKEIVKILLDNGAKVNAESLRGDTALHFACAGNGQEKIVKLLLAAGANVNATNRCGTTPLSKATAFCRDDLVKLLLDRGASKD